MNTHSNDDLRSLFGLVQSEIESEPEVQETQNTSNEIDEKEDDSTTNFYDEEAALASSRQWEYEQKLSRYDPNTPQQLFRHSFMHTGYLPVKVVKHEKEDNSFDDVLDMMKMDAIKQNGKTNQLAFCKIWHEVYKYEYSGLMLTPKGAITLDTFKHEIITMLSEMGSETVNLDAITKHICDMYIQMYVTDQEAELDLIPFRNGDLYIDNDKKGYTFHENQLSPVLYRFGYDFKNIPNVNVEPEFPNFKKWKDDLFDEDDQYTLKQMLGYLMQPSNDAQEAFFVIGQAGTGKSVLTEYIIPSLLGSAATAVQVTELFSDKFQTSASQGKLCVYDDDIGEATFSKEETGNFKSFVSGSKIKVERKYADPINIRNTAKLVCCGNHMIYSDDKTEGFTRRLHPIYIMPREIEDVDVWLGKKIKDEVSMIALWALEGLLELYSSKDFKPYRSERTVNRIESYAENQKWEERFIEENFEFKEDSFVYTEDIRDRLEDYMKENRDLPYDFRRNWRAVKKWLNEEGCDKYRFTYKRGVKRGDKYNATGYSHMAVKSQTSKPMMFYDDKGHLKIRVGKRKTDSENNA